MEPLKFEIDGAVLRQYLTDTGRTMQGLSIEMGCGNGYVSNATIINRRGNRNTCICVIFWELTKSVLNAN